METPIVNAVSFKAVRDMQTGQATVTVTVQDCPHCGRTHTAREISSAMPANYHSVFYSAGNLCPGGPLRVRMPWYTEAA
jgi:hypothetical protein